MARIGRAGRPIAGAFLAERERWFLWVPVGLALGVAIYFGLPFEPPLWAGAGATALAIGAAGLAPGGSPVRLGLLALAVVAGGFLAAQLRAFEVRTPVLADEVGPGEVTGRVVEIHPVAGGHRVVLDRLAIAGVAPEAVPVRARIALRTGADALAPGQWIRLWAVVGPPYEPVAPGAFDFARKAYFQRIGAMGYALGAPRLEAPGSDPENDGLGLRLNLLRHDLAARILAARAGESGAIAAALLVGERGAIPKDALAAFRASGIAHLLAISGLHVGLVAGLIFVVVRALLALVEPLALRYPVKKWAAAVTLVGTFGYLLVSGASIPTQRAFVMTGLVLVAILLDRTRISMRLIAWAAIGVLLAAPESLLGPSFQMSFAAAMALIATYELMSGPLARWQARSGWAQRPVIYLAGVLLTTVVAGLATGPFAAYHFNRIADYALVTNLAAVPITAFWIMPWGIATFLLIPFGAEGLALAPMGWGIDAVLAVARAVAGWPGSVSLIPAMPFASLVLLAGGGVWLCLWRRRWRLAGLAPIAAGLALGLFPARPDVLVDGEAKLFAVRTADGGLALSSRRRARFAGEIWLRHAGLAQAAPWPEEGVSADGRLACDSLACIYRAKGRVVALVSDPRALAEDCARADVVVSLVPVGDACRAPEVVIDRFDIWREGAHAITLGGDRIRVESVAGRRGRRPWTVTRGDREEGA